MNKEEADQLAADAYKEFVAGDGFGNDDGYTELCFKVGFLTGLKRGTATQDSDKQE